MRVLLVIFLSFYIINLGAQSLIGPEDFSTDLIVHGSSAPTNVWFAPDYYLPIDYSSNGGCTGGYAGYQGNWNNYWMNFLRTPEVDCTGLDTVILCFDLSNSFDASHTNNKVYFNMWIDGGYVNAVTNQTIYFDQSRNCEYIEVVYDLTPYIDKSAILFYLNASSGYNDSHTFELKFDNISVKAYDQGPYECNPFAGNDTSICGLCMTTNAVMHDSNTVVTWTVLSTPSATANATFLDENNPITDVCVNEYGIYEFLMNGQGSNCTGTDTVVFAFDEFHAANLLMDTASFPIMECGLTTTQLVAQNPPTASTGYWYDEVNLTSFFPTSNVLSPDSTVVSYYGVHNFHWVVVGAYGVCRDTTESVPVMFIEYPVVDAGVDITDCWNTTTLNAYSSFGIGYWLPEAGINFVDINDPHTLITADSVGIYNLVWHAENGPCISEDTVQVTFEVCSGVPYNNYPKMFQVILDRSCNKIRIESLNFHHITVNVEIFSMDGRKIFNIKNQDLPVSIDAFKGLSIMSIRSGDYLQKEVVIF